jgi:hypothetical protein
MKHDDSWLVSFSGIGLPILPVTKPFLDGV